MIVSIWIILLVAVNILMMAGLAICFVRLREKRADDPRLSYGLKLLQSKISVLEDLSDKTDIQVKQLLLLLENKIGELKTRSDDANKKIEVINQSMKKTLEVAEIFQTQVPHEEIVDRKVTNKYIQAARLAHRGESLQSIQTQVDLPAGELELIHKVNKEQLTFSEEQLPAWAEKHPLEQKEELFSAPKVDTDSLDELARDFKQACQDFAEKEDVDEGPSGDTSKVVAYQFKRGDVIYE